VSSPKRRTLKLDRVVLFSNARCVYCLTVTSAVTEIERAGVLGMYALKLFPRFSALLRPSSRSLPAQDRCDLPRGSRHFDGDVR
jgi:hypothetical protein